MHTNPFTFGGLALDAAFTDREAELEELAADMRNGQDVVLYAPRRYGKSSLVLRAAQEANPLFDLLRRHGEHAPLDTDTLREARRVARRGVLVKDAAPGAELTRLDLVPLPSRRTAQVVFGWAPAE